MQFLSFLLYGIGQQNSRRIDYVNYYNIICVTLQRKIYKMYKNLYGAYIHSAEMLHNVL